MAALLFMGSWLVGIRGLAALVHALPRLSWAIKAAAAAGEATVWLWVQAIIVVALCILAGVLLATSLLAMLLVEGSQVLVDDLGISVVHNSLPSPLARRLGAGRLAWKRVSTLDRQGPFFVVRSGGESDPSSMMENRNLKFFLVEDLERLVLLILERGSNIRFKG